MVKNISRKIESKSNLVGKHILDVITSGMYNNPLMVIREYIQNSADSIDQAINTGKSASNCSIKIDVCGKTRTITITDNGLGVSNDKILETLCTFGCSVKRFTENRGFRGIGRLGGLGYCEKLRFETKSATDKSIAIVSWDAKAFVEYANESGKFKSEDIFNKLIEIEFQKVPKNTKNSYFKVELIGICPFHEDSLMNISTLEKYLSQVAPVGYDNNLFSFSKELDSFFSELRGYKTYNIFLNNKQIFRPYHDKIDLPKSSGDEIKSIVKFDIKGINGVHIGKGWYAETSLMFSLPSSILMRGIRVRQGNIGIGNEYFLEKAFTERRFANWHIGEIHLDFSLRTNARRDGFEQTPEYEKFLEQTHLLGRHLSLLCRQYSERRSLIVQVDNAIQRIEAFLSSSFHIDKEVVPEKIRLFIKTIDSLSNKLNKLKMLDDYQETLLGQKKRLASFEKKPPSIDSHIDGRKLKNIKPRKLLISICEKISKTKGSSENKELLLEILSPYLKDSFLDNYK